MANQSVIDALKGQILGQGTTSKWSGEGFGSAEANAADMAKILSGIGITDISQFGQIPNYKDVSVGGYTLNGQPVYKSGSGYRRPYTVDFGETTTTFYKDVPASEAKSVVPIYGTYETVGVGDDIHDVFTPVENQSSVVVDSSGKAKAQVGTTYGNKLTGQAVPNTYSERQTGNAWGGTFAGSGNTGYRVQFDSAGNPYFYTTGASSSDFADIAPLLAVASFIPGVAPFAAAANAAIAASQGNVLGALASAAGIPGVSDALGSGVTSALTAANQATNLVNAIESGNLAGALASGAGLTGTSGAQIGDTGFTVGQAVQGLGALQAAQSGNLSPLVKLAGSYVRGSEAPKASDYEVGSMSTPGGTLDTSSAGLLGTGAEITAQYTPPAYTPEPAPVYTPPTYTPEPAQTYVPPVTAAPQSEPATVYGPQPQTTWSPTYAEPLYTPSPAAPSLQDLLSQYEVPAPATTPEPTVEPAPVYTPQVYTPEPQTVEPVAPSLQDLLSQYEVSAPEPETAPTPETITPPQTESPAMNEDLIDWAALYATPTTDPTTGETITGMSPSDYAIQDLQISPENGSEYQGNLQSIFDSYANSIAADNIDVGGGWNPATGTGDQATADAAAATGVTSSASLPSAGMTDADVANLIKSFGSGSQSVLDKIKSLLSNTKAVTTGISALPAFIGALGALKGLVGDSSTVTVPTYAAPARDTRTLPQWDWNAINAQAQQQGLAPGQFIARNLNQAMTGGFNQQPAATQEDPVTMLARGGVLTRLAQGGGSGRDDTIPARLSDGEYVMDAETVSLLGDGSTKDGARRLDEMRAKIRQHKGKSMARGKFSANAKSPLAYLKGA